MPKTLMRAASMVIAAKSIEPIYMNPIDHPEMEVSVEGWGKRLEQVLIEKGMSNAEVGDAIGVADSTIGRYINKGQNPTLENVISLANHLQVDPAWLLFGAEPSRDVWVLKKQKVQEDPRKAKKAIAGLLKDLLGMLEYADSLID